MKTRRAVSPLPSKGFALGFFSLLQSNIDPEEDPDLLLQVAEQVFEGRPEYVEAFEVRFLAILDILDREEVSMWARYSSDDLMHLHPALVEAASEMKVNKNGRFPLRLLLKRVEEIEATLYQDWVWP